MAGITKLPSKREERLWWKTFEKRLDRYGYSEELKECIKAQCMPIIQKYVKYELKIDLLPDPFPVNLEEEVKRVILERFKKVITECVTRMQKSFFVDLISLQKEICILQDEIK